jgi:CO/xanthine dehydrogenase Mo-binding subunit
MYREVIFVRHSKSSRYKICNERDLGEIVNPDNVRAQVEGAIIMALGAAVKPGITLEHGAVV